jgi:DNA polymerase-3 subunit epsilon
MHEIVLDTETTGLDPNPANKETGGHRLVELAAVELDGVRIGRRWHSLFNPERPVDLAATDIHGWTWKKLEGEPKFTTMADSFLSFIEGATLIAHNAPFDASFLKAEMWRCGHGGWSAEWIDTLPIARKKIPRIKHNLDALCRHYGIRKSARKLHGAMLDTILLAQIYVRLAGRFDQLELEGVQGGEIVYLRGGEYIIVAACDKPHPGLRPEPLPSRFTVDELRAHKAFMEQLKEDQQRLKTDE